jgi:hypothetical protein
MKEELDIRKVFDIFGWIFPELCSMRNQIRINFF